MGVRWGILSTAAINQPIMRAAAASDRCEVVAVASREVHRAEEYARRNGVPRAYGDYEQLLDDPRVEAVYIPLPNGMHVDWTLRAIAAGKHVLVEKPFTRHAAQAARALDAAAAAGLVLSEGFMWRHHPQTLRLQELVRAGTIGAPLLVRASFAFDLATMRGRDDTRFDPALDGGSLMDVGCYCVSAIRLLAGEPERVSAERRVGESGVDVAFAATMRMPGEVIGQFDCGFATPHRDELEVVGTEGSLFVDDPWHCRRPRIEVRRGPETVDPVGVPEADAYLLELENVSAAIRGEAPLRVPASDALGQARAIEALHRSAETGAVVTPAPAEPVSG